MLYARPTVFWRFPYESRPICPRRSLLPLKLIFRVNDAGARATSHLVVNEGRAGNVPHTFWNSASESARVLEVILPAGFGGYFEGLAGLLSSMPPDFAGVPELTGGYGTTLRMQRVPKILEKHGVMLRWRERRGNVGTVGGSRLFVTPVLREARFPVSRCIGVRGRTRSPHKGCAGTGQAPMCGV